VADLVELAYETLENWLSLGHEPHERAGARFVRDLRTPQIYDASFAARVRAASPGEIDALLETADEIYAGLGHRQFLRDPATPLPFEARLQLQGYASKDEVVLVLEAALRARGPAVELRPVEREADWDAITELCWLDHQEEVSPGFHEPWPLKRHRGAHDLEPREGGTRALLPRARRFPRPRHRHRADRRLRRDWRGPARGRPRATRTARGSPRCALRLPDSPTPERASAQTR